MTQDKRLSGFILLSPLIVLLFTRFGVELSIRLFERQFSWITAFLGYYISILIVYFIARFFLKVDLLRKLDFRLRPVPKTGLLFWTIIIPALLPIAALISQFNAVPPLFFVYILVFAVVNSFFEEIYWRGFLRFLPGNGFFRTILTAGLFSFSHFFFWNYWYGSLIILIPTVISTFLMGVLWMHFVNKQKNIIYPILSHLIVDILNCSVAVYYGLIHPEHF